MIKIRYADLPGGLHVRAVARGRDTIVYLLPGLTVLQRRAALRRALRSARMGHGPPLSAAGLGCAMMADRIRTTVRNAACAMRVHPAMFVPVIVLLLSAATAYVLLSSVTVKIHSPQAGTPETALVPPFTVAVSPARAMPPRGSDRPGGPAPGGHAPGRTGGHAPGRAGRPAPAPAGGHPTPAPSAVPSPSPDPTLPEPGPSPSPGPSEPLPSPGPGGSGSATGSTPGTSSGSGSGSGGGVCVDIGPLGVCLSV